MHRKIVKSLSLFLVSVFLLSSFAWLYGCGDDENTIVIGVIAPKSGSEAAYGTDMINSYKLAVEEINAAGGVLGKKLKLYEADDGANANMAATAASKIVSKGVDFVVGGYASGAVTPILQQFYDANLLFLITAANSTNITKAGFDQSNRRARAAWPLRVDLCPFSGGIRFHLGLRDNVTAQHRTGLHPAANCRRARR